LFHSLGDDEKPSGIGEGRASFRWKIREIAAPFGRFILNGLAILADAWATRLQPHVVEADTFGAEEGKRQAGTQLVATAFPAQHPCHLVASGTVKTSRPDGVVGQARSA